MNNTIVELTVNNHPGVMSHVTGLFSRRGFNLDGIIVSRIGNGDKSKMYLLVDNNERLGQITSQLTKLYDVIDLETKDEYDPEIFDKLHDIIKA